MMRVQITSCCCDCNLIVSFVLLVFPFILCEGSHCELCLSELHSSSSATLLLLDLLRTRVSLKDISAGRIVRITFGRWKCGLNSAFSFSGASQTEGSRSLTCQGQQDYYYGFSPLFYSWHWRVKKKKKQGACATCPPVHYEINWFWHLFLKTAGLCVLLSITKVAVHGGGDAPTQL